MLSSIRKNINEIRFYFNRLLNLSLEILLSKNLVDAKMIPIVINNRNRLDFLKKLINSLEKRGYNNIYILDNSSNFEPLLNYYQFECKYPVIELGVNLGHLALWKSNFFKRVRRNYYVYTDSDIEIADECPDDFLNIFRNLMIEDSKVQKIGIYLKYDDLPDHYALKSHVVNWESSLYKKKYNQNYYISKVDTTFALYRPFFSGGAHEYHLSLRSSEPFSARHLPWYNDSSNLSLEEKHYIHNSHTSTFWTNQRMSR